jgi:predicted porin
MQKKLIALAIAGLASGAAFAQTNVQIYGVVDAYYAHGSAGGTGAVQDDKFNGINAGGLSGSRLGFKGTEDLGSGLKAAFVLEYGTLDTTANATTNTAVAAGTSAAQTTNSNGMDNWRQAYVGLTGGFGTAVFGRLQNPGYDFAAKYDAHGASIFSSVGQLSDNAGLSISARDALGRLDNAAAYISPSFGGVVVKAAYAFGEQIDGTAAIGTDGAAAATAISDAQSVWALAADYDNGPLSVGAVYHKLNDIGGTRQTVGSNDRTEWGLGVKYNFGMITPFASYQRSNQDNGSTAAADDTRIRMWNIGARANVTANGSVGLTYARLKNDTQGANNEKVSSWGLDYQHMLSKRTTAYVGYAKMSNSSGIAYEMLNLKGSASGQTVSASNGENSSQFAVGLRHTF